jgi:hypothetical protein
MLYIQVLIRIYNKHPHSNPLKKIKLLMAYIGKVAFNIDGSIIHSNHFIPFNYKDLQPLSSN